MDPYAHASTSAGPAYDYLGLTGHEDEVALADWTDLASATVWGGAAPATVLSPTATAAYGSSSQRLLAYDGVDNGSQVTWGVVQAVSAGAGTWTLRFSWERQERHATSYSVGTFALGFINTSGQDFVGAGVYVVSRMGETNTAQAYELGAWDSTTDANDQVDGSWIPQGIFAGVGVPAQDVVVTLARDGADAWTARAGPYGTIPEFATQDSALRTAAGAGWVGLFVQENVAAPSRPRVYIRSQLLSTGTTLPWRQAVT